MLTGECLWGFTDTMAPSRVPTASSHPVPQYGHTVRVQLLGAPSVSNVASSSAPVGQVSTQAPQLTHELFSRSGPSGSMCTSAPRSRTMPHELPLHLVADAHATAALNAAGHVHRDERVRTIDVCGIGLAAQLLGPARAWRSPGGRACQDRPARPRRDSRLASICSVPRRAASRSGGDVSMVSLCDGCGACGYRALAAPFMRTRHRRQAPVGVEPFVMTQRRQMHADCPQRVCERRCVRKRDVAAIQHGMRHVARLEQRECHVRPCRLAEFPVLTGGKFPCVTAGRRIYPHIGEERGGTTLAPSIDVTASLRATIGLTARPVDGAARGCAASRGRRRARCPRVLRGHQRIARVWVDCARAADSRCAETCIARLRGVAEDGLESGGLPRRRAGQAGCCPRSRRSTSRLSTWRRSTWASQPRS